MDEVKELSVSDLSLLLAFHLRLGTDLTRYLSDDKDGCFILDYMPEDDFQMIGAGIALKAKFDKEGNTIFCKFINNERNI